ncbi:MAG TPA: Fe-S protein assembly co-chaperone HscB [Rubrivivax sp.]|nr:Fe-S protein assembly co-chaperone HscB [Rubrivivax sp.]
MNIDDDDFTLFGQPECFALDAAQIDRRWRELQASVHPDRFAARGAAAQRIAMQWSVRVNEAYRRLKDPLKRAAYLCERRGVAVDAERNTAMPREFLQQQMAWREALDDARDGQTAQALDRQVSAHERLLLSRLQQQFDLHGDAAAAAQTLRELMFVARFRRDVEQRLESFEP